MKTKTIISRFNKVSGYDFNTLKQWGITPQAVEERTGCPYLGEAYELIIRSTKLLRLLDTFVAEDAQRDIEYYNGRANWRLKMHELEKEIKESQTNKQRVIVK